MSRATVTVDPAALGLAPASVADLQGGDAETNAVFTRRVLAGEQGPHRDVVLLNAAAGLLVAGVVPSIEAGLTRAAASIDDGSAATALERLVTVSQAATSAVVSPGPVPLGAPGRQRRQARAGVLVAAQIPDRLQVVAAVRLECDQRAGVDHAGQAGDAPRHDLGQLLVPAHPDHGHDVRLAGNGVHLGHALEVGELVRQVGHASRFGVDEDEGVHHEVEAIRRLRWRRYHPKVPAAADQPSFEVPLSLVRPALELAWAVARVGADARPPIAVPRRIRPFLRAAKLPDRVLLTIRQVLDEEDEFRARVADLAEEAVLGRAAWLWLVRPEGWSGELQELAAVAEAAAADAEQERQAKALQRQLDSAQADLARLRGELAVLRRSGTVLEQQAEEERRARRKAESDRDRIQSTLQSVRTEHARLEQALSELSAEASVRADEAAGAVEAGTALSHELDQARTLPRSDFEGRYDGRPPASGRSSSQQPRPPPPRGRRPH